MIINFPITGESLTTSILSPLSVSAACFAGYLLLMEAPQGHLCTSLPTTPSDNSFCTRSHLCHLYTSDPKRSSYETLSTQTVRSGWCMTLCYTLITIAASEGVITRLHNNNILDTKPWEFSGFCGCCCEASFGFWERTMRKKMDNSSEDPRRSQICTG